MKLERLTPVNERPKSLLDKVLKYPYLCDVIGQSLISEIQELLSEENALSDIYRDYKDDTEKSLYGDCLYIWNSKNINDNMIRQRVHELLETVRKQVIKHLKYPIEIDFKTIDFKDKSDSNVNQLRYLLQKDSMVKKARIDFLRNALDMENEVRDKALSFQMQTAIDTYAFKNLLLKAENMLSVSSMIDAQEELNGFPQNSSALPLEHSHPTDPAIQDLLNQMAYLDTPITMNVNGIDKPSPEEASIPLQPSPLLIRKPSPRRRVIGGIKPIQSENIYRLAAIPSIGSPHLLRQIHQTR